MRKVGPLRLWPGDKSRGVSPFQQVLRKLMPGQTDSYQRRLMVSETSFTSFPWDITGFLAGSQGPK